jgi:hypothetical protein
VSYTIKYRGGPRKNKVEQFPDLPMEIPMLYIKPTKVTAMLQQSPFSPSSTDIIGDTKRGVYSRVYTPLKNGAYLYVWIDQS